ncbi:MAG TPA: 2,3-bisphosphoglycerate-independent phosphoglycerate mutase, partial [Thermoanaerobaculia bacterium]|nr:2,3-bisphosphoglycerate-independent phosphoglycerate mutase [Thermoanaerobaculia bacterium]
MARPRPVLLAVLDGFGRAPDSPGNAVSRATTPTLDGLYAGRPWTMIETSGERVGLPDGQMGNSEVGHTILGAGRVVYQDIVRISKSIKDGDFFTTPALVGACAAAKAGSGTIHFFGLLSHGGVHSLQEHLYALLDLASRQKVPRVVVHAFLDGRDTPPTSGVVNVRELLERLSRYPAARLGSIIGRYYAMDRDKRWERVEKAYRLLTEGEAVKVVADSGAAAAVEAAYARSVTDEFMEPISVRDSEGGAPRIVADGDAAVFFNFRADRPRELSRAFFEADFPGFPRRVHPKLTLTSMTEYQADFPLPVAFPPQSLRNSFPQILAARHMTNLRVAETEKYAHVTFFFNGGEEKVYPGEERILVPSPKVATYDLKPEMSAFEVTEKLLAAIASDRFDFILVNYANCDMVGHTGVFEAAKKSVEAVDACLGRVLAALKAKGGAAIVTADHGNAEKMWDDERNEPYTAHTVGPVPLLLALAPPEADCARLRENGSLEDVSPTLLGLM